MLRRTTLSVFLLLACAGASAADSRVEKNVVYGMYSGLALLLDVHRPEKPNGLGVVLIPGSGWHAPQHYGATGLKDGGRAGSMAFAYLPPIVAAGYTVFVVNHRAAPRFRYPAAVEDAQRAVRFVRFHAKDYGIDPARLGAVGHSSGGHLAVMLGVMDGAGAADDPDPVNRLSSRVQCVVAGAAPGDIAKMDNPNAVSFIGHVINPVAPDPVAVKAYRDASPVTYVAATSAPMLLLHGEVDDVVPVNQAEIMLKAMQAARADVKLIRVPNGGHRFATDAALLAEVVGWLDGHLKN
jgi:acetyl esterase/lipase